MDAISFAASLTALIAVVTTTSKTVYNLHRTFRNAPKNIESLVEQVYTFECLLKEIQIQLQEHRNNALPQEMLSQVWGASIRQMERDMKSLDDVLSKVRPLLKKKSISAKVLLSIRETFSEKEIAKYLGKIGTHCIMLTSIQMMTCSRKLDQVSENVIRVGDECKSEFRRISSRLLHFTDQVGHGNRADFQMVSSQLTAAEESSETKFQTVLGCLNDHMHSDDNHLTKLDEPSRRHLGAIDASEAGFQSVQSSLGSATTERDKSTQAILSQLGDQLQQMLRNCVRVEESTEPPIDSHRASPVSTKEETVFRQSYSYRFYIGALNLKLSWTHRRTLSKRSPLGDCTESKIEALFIPPRWLSSFAIKYNIMFSCGFIDNHLHYGMNLTPLTTNRSPIFLRAVTCCDVKSIEKMFRGGLAHPTDHILGRNGLVHWTTYSGLSLGGSAYAIRSLEMFRYMIERNLPGQDDLISQFVENDYRCSNIMEYSEQFLDHLHNYLRHGGKIFSGKSSVLRNVLLRNNFCSSISWVPGLLCHSAELLMIDDLSSLEICLIGTLASVDTEFQDLLKKYLMSCRSPFCSNSVPKANSLYESIFGTTSIISHLCKLQEREYMDFLELLCRTGSASASMIKLFIDNGINFNETSIQGANLLGAAVEGGNTDVVHVLLNAGVNAATALPIIFIGHKCRGYRHDSYDGDLLRLLVDVSKPTLLEETWDLLEKMLVHGYHKSYGVRASKFDLEMVRTLLARQLFFPGKLLGKSIHRYRLQESYMFLAINQGLSDVVELLLQNGAEADAQITDLFHVPSEVDKVFEPYTWLTLSVVYGSVNCANALIQHGASVTALDLQIAKCQTLGLHPRFTARGVANHRAFLPGRWISIKQDLETLAFVEQAFYSRAKDTESLELYEYTVYALKVDFQSPTGQEIVMSVLRDTLRNGLYHVLKPRHIEYIRYHLNDLYRNLMHLWRLSFFEALFMRFFYVVSYFLLCAVEVYALARRRKRIPKPSRSLLSAGAVLLLVFLSGSSFFGSTSS